MNQGPIERGLQEWGETLLRPGLMRFGRPGKDLRSANRVGSGVRAIRPAIRAVVRRYPEVMVKVTGGGRGMGPIKAHFAYISRRGALALETESGDQVEGQEELQDLAREWQLAGAYIPGQSHRREAYHLMLSMPPDTNAESVRGAARAFARNEFALHKFAMVLHEPGTDSRSNRPHVHMIVRAQANDGTRLNPRKADLARWRQAFADRLMERGVAASATRRQSRGILQLRKTLRDHHKGVQRNAGTAGQSEQAKATEVRVLKGWREVIELLSHSENAEDRRLSRDATEFVRSMPTQAKRLTRDDGSRLAFEPSVNRGTQSASSRRENAVDRER